MPVDPAASLKQQAAEFAVGFVQSGMIVGLGTGTTAVFAVRRLGALLAEGKLRDISGVPTSKPIEDEARRFDIPILPDGAESPIDIAIDGADEIDPQWNIIKGRGGALLREKIAAQSARRFIVVADDSKLTNPLGSKHAVPVEVLPFGWIFQRTFIRSLGAVDVTLREAAPNQPFVTDNGNYILDCRFNPIADPRGLAAALESRAGIIEHGLFLGLATDVIIAGAEGIRELCRP